MPLPALVIFDCDGVLVDSERLAVHVDAQLLRELGWHLTAEEIVHRFMGRSDAYYCAEIEEHLGRPLPEGWAAQHEHRYRQAFDAELTPVAGVVAALDELDASGVATCVASSGSHDKMRHTLRLTGLYDRFAGRIFSGDEVKHGKPAPDLFLLAAERTRMAPDSCTVVEDSRFGVQAARAAAMRAVGYAGGLTHADWLLGHDTVVIDDMGDLVSSLGFCDTPGEAAHGDSDASVARNCGA